jgi:tetratricopeptide (TPR) repeat protein
VSQGASSSTRRKIPPVFESFEQALASHAQGELTEAEQHYEAVLEADDRHFGAVHGLGLIRLQQERFADAAALFRRATKIERRSAEAHHHMAVALTGLGRPEEAIERFGKALAIRPDFAEAHDSLGHALQLLSRSEEAIAHHEKAIAAKPAYAQARNNLGNALHRLGRSEKAILQYEKALAIRPDYAEAHNNLGRALATLGRHEEAITHYEKALAIRPEYVDAHINLGSALGALGRHEEAMAQYDRALAIRPDDFEALVKQGYTLAALGRDEDAISRYDKALALRANDAEALIGRGNALLALGEDREAAEVFKNLFKRGLRSINVLLGLTSLPAPMIGLDLLSEIANAVRYERHNEAEFDSLAAFVRAAALDRTARYAEAWQHLVLANRTLFLARQEELGDVIARQRANLARLWETPARVAGDVRDSGLPISLFILGPSRSGKTTMEKLVGSLDSAKRGYENSLIQNALSRALPKSALPARIWFEDLPPGLYSLCYELYIKELVGRAGSARIFTNTYPSHIHEADLISAAFPNVRFIFVKRNVEDNVLRIYQRTYAKRNIYAYDLKTARDHVVWYHQMMDLLAEKFSDIVRIIQYEDMVAEPAAALRTAAEFCGVPMSDGPLPPIGDDRGCAAPYLSFIAAELEG